LKKAATHTTKLLFLCSPNNPTGNAIDEDKIREILGFFPGIVVIDEAYVDFAPERSFVPYLKDYPNLIILQTFSKAWGLAGVRAGLAFASKEIIGYFNKIKSPYNISTLNQQAILQAIANKATKDAYVSQILEARAQLIADLQEIPEVEKIYPSDANFLLVKVPNGTAVYQKLCDKKIIVRDRSKVELCENCLRITVGTPAENTALVKALASILKG
jgi:histidinol-phosphate aminotransferase